MKFTLPYPISANRYWRSFVPRGHSRAIVCVSDEAKAYKNHAGWIAKAAGVTQPLRYNIEMRLTLVPANGVCMDLDNCLKVAIDSLKGVCYLDDRQVYRIVAERANPDQKGARLEVEIVRYEPPVAALFEQVA